MKNKLQRCISREIDNKFHLSQFCSFMFVMFHDIPKERNRKREK